jgi:hypothetical protein
MRSNPGWTCPYYFLFVLFCFCSATPWPAFSQPIHADSLKKEDETETQESSDCKALKVHYAPLRHVIRHNDTQYNGIIAAPGKTLSYHYAVFISRV